MDDEVRIRVVADDDADRGFSSARGKARKLGDDVDGELRKVGPKIGQNLGGGMLSGLSGSLPSFAQFGGVIGAIMAPTLGAAVSAGLMGGAGGAGIVGGLVLAAKDPRVASAGKALGEQVSGDLKEAASAFVPVALQSIDKLRGGFAKILPDIKAIFDKSATFVAPLLDGLTDGATSIVRGIRKAVEGAQPVFESFGALFAQVGDSVGGLFEGIADDGPAAAAAIDDIGMALTNTIDLVGKGVNALTELKGQFESLDGAIDSNRYKLEDNVSWLDLTADGYEKGSEAAELYRKGLIGAAGSADDYNHYLAEQKEATDAATSSTEAQTSALKDLADEMLAQTDPLFALIDGQRSVSEAQKDYNDALKKHGPRSSEAKEALDKLGRAAFQLNDKVGDAAGGFNGKLTPAMRTALRNAGLTAPQINNLERSLRRAASAADDWEGTYQQTYITSFKTFGKPYSQDGISRGQVGGLAHGGIKGAASGMLGSGLTWVGESGPELVDLPPGAHVRSNPDSMATVGGGSGMGMDQPIVINLQVDGDTVARASLPSLQKLNRTQYAGDVTRMFPATR